MRRKGCPKYRSKKLASSNNTMSQREVVIAKRPPHIKVDGTVGGGD